MNSGSDYLIPVFRKGGGAVFFWGVLDLYIICILSDFLTIVFSQPIFFLFDELFRDVCSERLQNTNGFCDRLNRKNRIFINENECTRSKKIACGALHKGKYV